MGVSGSFGTDGGVSGQTKVPHSADLLVGAVICVGIHQRLKAIKQKLELFAD